MYFRALICKSSINECFSENATLRALQFTSFEYLPCPVMSLHVVKMFSSIERENLLACAYVHDTTRNPGQVFLIACQHCYFHRTAEAGRDLCSSCGLTHLFKQGLLELVSQNRVQTPFELLQEWRLHDLGATWAQYSVTPTVKKYFLMSMGTSCFRQ